MVPLRLSEHLIAYDLESHIHDLLRQKDLLQTSASTQTTILILATS